MPRIKLPNRDALSAEQKTVYDGIVSGPRGKIIGPLRAAIHSPGLASRWSNLGQFLRYDLSIPRRWRELAIIVVGRRWSSDVEWWVHSKEAVKEGVPQAAIAALSEGRNPIFDDATDHLVYEFTRQIQMKGRPDLVTYNQVKEEWGEKGVVELTALIGYYTMVAISLNAHEIPLPDGVATDLEHLGSNLLFDIQKANNSE